VAGSSQWIVQPTASFTLTEMRFGLNGVSNETNVLKGFGFLISFQKVRYDDNGLNYADYSIGAGIIGSGTTNDRPFLTPKAILMLAVLNNLFEIGPGVDLTKPTDGRSQFTLNLQIGVSPLLNP
jgi:hypothetical protein